MRIQFTRNTGFFGMGSPLMVTKNKQKWFTISHNGTKAVTFDEPEITVQIKFGILRSKPFVIQNKGKGSAFFMITMNPVLVTVYLALFGVMLLIPLMRLNVLGILVLLLMYFVFMISLLGNAYLVKEIAYGQTGSGISE